MSSGPEAASFASTVVVLSKSGIGSHGKIYIDENQLLRWSKIELYRQGITRYDDGFLTLCRQPLECVRHVRVDTMQPVFCFVEPVTETWFEG